MLLHSPFTGRTAAWLLCASSAFADLRPDGQLALTNADFAQGLRGWTEVSGTGAAHAQAAPGPLGRPDCARVELGAAASTRLELPAQPVWPVLPPPPGLAGEELELGAWVLLEEPASSGSVALELLARGPFGERLLGRSAELDASAPPERWLWLRTHVVQRLLEHTAQLLLRVQITRAGVTWIDDVAAGIRAPARHALPGAGFERPADLAAWSALLPTPPLLWGEGYWGLRGARLDAPAPQSLARELAVADAPGAPQPGQALQAGAWVRFDGAAATQDEGVELVVRAYGESGAPLAQLARSFWRPLPAERGLWRWIHAPPLQAVVPAHARLRIELHKRSRGRLAVDHIELGESAAVRGLPADLVTCAYVGRFRSPLYAGPPAVPGGSRAAWGTWAWTDTPACDPAWTALAHDPECTTSPACVCANGRRDLAVTTLRGIDELPLAGAYDSRDPELLRWHARLAEAAGIDAFTFDFTGHALAESLQLAGGEALDLESLRALLDVCEQPGRTLKVALKYEPKVHLLGWVAPGASFADAKRGIARDLARMAQEFSPRRSVLRVDGRLFVYIFFNAVCMPSGPCLTDADWLEIRAEAQALCGQSLLLVADDTPQAGGAFEGLSRWGLVTPAILEYPTFTALRAGASVQPAPGALEALAGGLAQLSRTWAANDARQLWIPIVWPGFDDSGVAGWGDWNVAGADGAPICVRVASTFDGTFFTRTLAAARESGAWWVQVATWNDWNEWTQVEPRFDGLFARRAALGLSPPNDASERALGRLLELQAWIAARRGRAPDRLGLIALAAERVRESLTDPAVLPYD